MALTPYLAVSDGRAAIAFYELVFGAELDTTEVFEMEDGRLGHATLTIGDARLFLSDEFPDVGAHAPTSLGGSTVAVIIDVESADATMDAAIAAGGTLDRPVKVQFGHRSGWFVDPWGHRWSPTSPEL